MKIAVVGAGITGIVSAYELSKQNIQVDLYEKDSEIGGIAGTFSYDGFSLEKYYHHFFKSDKYIEKLSKEVGVYDNLKWVNTPMGYFSQGALYDFGTPVSLLKFKPLDFLDKIRFGMSVVKILSINNWKHLEEITAYDWIVKNAGEEVFNTVWKPLLVGKFGDRYKDISMAWLWGKIKLRGSSKENGREALGYFDGSIGVLLHKLEDKLIKNGCNIILDSEVQRIDKKSKFNIITKLGESTYDGVISTIPLPEFIRISRGMLPNSYIEEKKSIEYTAVSCMILLLKRQLSKYYWLNIGDESIPFGGLIEHTNMIGKKVYKGNNILYISNYLYKDNAYFDMDIEDLLDQYIPHIKKINPKFDKSWINDKFLFKDVFAQPIIKKGYSVIKPEFETPIEGLYVANMCSIYPEDRGVNYAIKYGIDATKKVGKLHEK